LTIPASRSCLSGPRSLRFLSNLHPNLPPRLGSRTPTTAGLAGAGRASCSPTGLFGWHAEGGPIHGHAPRSVGHDGEIPQGLKFIIGHMGEDAAGRKLAAPMPSWRRANAFPPAHCLSMSRKRVYITTRRANLHGPLPCSRRPHGRSGRTASCSASTTRIATIADGARRTCARACRSRPGGSGQDRPPERGQPSLA